MKIDYREYRAMMKGLNAAVPQGVFLKHGKATVEPKGRKTRNVAKPKT